MTHLVLGAAAGSLVAASASPGVITGAIWLGVVGGGYPDWLDLRSEMKGAFRLRHRGVSHGIPVAILMTTLIYLALSSLDGAAYEIPDGLRVDEHTARLWTVAFGAGITSHLLSDACTIAGIRPLLPFSRWRFWLLPRMFRGRSDGFINTIAMFAGVTVLGFGLVIMLDRLT